MRRNSYLSLILAALTGFYAGMWVGGPVRQNTFDASYFHSETIVAQERPHHQQHQQQYPNRTLSAQSETWTWRPYTLDYEPLGPEFTDAPWWQEFESNRTLYLAPYTGMCNTLQAMASVLTLAYHEQFNVQIVLKASLLADVPWEELFAFPIFNSSTTFPDGEINIYETKSCSNPLTEHGAPPFIFHERDDFEWTPHPDETGEIGCVRSCCWREPPFPQTVTWFFRVLRPAPFLENVIHTFMKNHEWDKYQNVGIHVRRTDNMENMVYLMGFQTIEHLKGKNDLSSADTLLPLEHYTDRMKQVKAAWPLHELGAYQTTKPLRFFLATDNEDAKKFVLEQFSEGEVIFFEKDKVEFSEKDTLNVQHGIIDLYLLAACNVLIGTPFSTFSETATIIGGNLYLEPDFKYTIDSDVSSQ